MGFLAKVLVGSIGVYVVNKVLDRTGLGDKIVEVGVGIADQLLTNVASAIPAQHRNGG